MPTTALAMPAPLLPPLLLLLSAMLLHSAAGVEPTGACPGTPTLLSNCSDYNDYSGWCVLWPEDTADTVGCINDNSTSSDDCSWEARGIVDVVDLPFDCETLYVCAEQTHCMNWFLTAPRSPRSRVLASFSSDLSYNNISRLVSPELGVMETSALVQMCALLASSARGNIVN